MFITAVNRCAPPANKPTPAERAACLPWLVKELELPMRSSLYVGLAVTAHDDAQLATTTIDRVSLEGRSKPE